MIYNNQNMRRNGVTVRGLDYGSSDLELDSKSPVLSPHTRDGRFGSKVVRLDPKLDKSGTFSVQISEHLAHRAWTGNG